MPTTPTASGALELAEWFGSWPSFHDAEIMSIHLNREGRSSLTVHTWQMTSDLDAANFYILQKHVVVMFSFEEIYDLDLKDFSSQNVIFGLALEELADGYTLSLSPCYGIAGWIKSRRLSIDFGPDSPATTALASLGRTLPHPYDISRRRPAD